MMINEEEKNAIEYAMDLMDLYRYTNNLTYGEEENNMVKNLLNIIEKLADKTTCLHCGKGKPGYCEDCYQKLIAMEAEHQRINGELRKKINNLEEVIDDMF